MILIAVAGIGAALLAAMLAVALFDLVARPGFRRMAFRNVMRRKTEAVLVVLGSSLGTAIIAASFLVGATFNASIRDGARTELGPIDQTVTVSDLAKLDTVAAKLSRPPLAHSDGVMTVVAGTASVTSQGETTLSEPSAKIAEVRFDAARRFGGHPADTGFVRAGPTPREGEAVVGTRLASTLKVAPGGLISLHMYGTTMALRVRQVLPRLGVAGSSDVFIAPGTLRRLVTGTTVAGAQAPEGRVLVSVDGRVFPPAATSEAVTSEIRARTAATPGVDVTSSKQDLLRDARAQGQSLGQLYAGVGVFSVLAGILLLVNLFVMLAEERKRELGLARATGLKRWHLVRIFTLEGAMYAVAAAFVGAFAGTAVGWLIAQATSRLFRQNDSSFTLRFVAPTGDLVIAALIGLGLAMVTVWATSLRIARLNIISALRDTTDVSPRRYPVPSSTAATVVVAGGAALGAYGVVAAIPLLAVIGPPVALVASIPLLRPIIGRRMSTAIASVGTLAWCVGAFTFLTRITSKSGVAVFVVQGVIMVAAAVGLSTALDRVWVVMLESLTRTGRGLAGRLGLAYPLDRLFRTSMLLAMYALIMFTLTFLAVYGEMFGGQAAAFTRGVSAGNDLLVDSSPTNPVTRQALATSPGVASAAPLLRAAPDFTSSFHGEASTWPLTGFDATLLKNGAPSLSVRSRAFSSDRSVYEAMLRDPTLIVVDEQFLSAAGAKTPDGSRVVVGDHVVAINPLTGERRSMKVIGLIENDMTEVGAFASSTSVRSLMGDAAAPSRFFVRTKPGVDPSSAAEQLQSSFVSNGVDAKTFRSIVDSKISVQVGFFKLMQSYMAIGLVVGIAGLAVVMVRASRERRQQLGMLRALGFPADTVRSAFLVEAAFISLQGIATGVGLGLLVSYQMLSHSAALGGDPLPYAVPGMTLLALGVIPFAASLAVALIPASQAASVNPAEVLRLAD